MSRQEANQTDVADATPASENGAPAAPATEQTRSTESATELEQLRAQVSDFEDRWKRSAAEFANYRRRTEQERVALLRSANAGLILELLPVLDDLERALASVPTGEAESEWVKGARLVERKFRQILERQGLTPIDAVGQPFDPNRHEAVGGAGTVVTEEYRRGYTFHDRVLRPSMVVVGEAEPAATQA